MPQPGFQVIGGTLEVSKAVRAYFVAAGVELRLSLPIIETNHNNELDDLTEVDFDGYERQVPDWEEAYVEDFTGHVISDFVEFNNESGITQTVGAWYLVDPAGAGRLLMHGPLEGTGTITVGAGNKLALRVDWRHSQIYPGE